jgi:hypothetical protein
VQIWVSSSDRTTPIEREMESPVETHTPSLLSGGRAATYARVVSGLLSYTQYDGRVAACTRMESGPPACGPASPRQPFRYFRVKGTVPRDFRLLFFSRISFPQALSIPLGPFRIFRKFSEIFEAQG